MGEVNSIAALVNTPGMDDRNILTVISPPTESGFRDALVRGADVTMPPLAAWRFDAPVGHLLNPAQHIGTLVRIISK